PTTWSHERGRALAMQLVDAAPAEVVRSLARVDDEHAWELRERLYDAHPDAVLASLAWLSCERAANLRERWLEQRAARLGQYEVARAAARSVHAVGDERAWHLRERAHESAPIAALASIGNLRCERSWSRRERTLSRATKVVMATLKLL